MPVRLGNRYPHFTVYTRNRYPLAIADGRPLGFPPAAPRMWGWRRTLETAERIAASRVRLLTERFLDLPRYLLRVISIRRGLAWARLLIVMVSTPAFISASTCSVSTFSGRVNSRR